MPVSEIGSAILLLLYISSTETGLLRHECIGDTTIPMSCSSGSVIVVTRAQLGRAADYSSGSPTCPATQDGCSRHSTVLADTCNWKDFCLVQPDTLRIDLGALCGHANYISFSYDCLSVSSTINICAASLEVVGLRYIVNDRFPAGVPREPHECQCTIQRHPGVSQRGSIVEVGVVDALLQGTGCQQRLSSTLMRNVPTHVCSSELRYKSRPLSSATLSRPEEQLNLKFQKMDNTISKSSFFVVSLKATGAVRVNCRNITMSVTTTPTHSQSRALTRDLRLSTTGSSASQTETPTLGESTSIDIQMAIIGGTVAIVILILVAVVLVAFLLFRRSKRNPRSRQAIQEETLPEADCRTETNDACY